jgi:HD-GYP domain-containing protein (c-di-GMP phosphodiesterase class II)
MSHILSASLPLKKSININPASMPGKKGGIWISVRSKITIPFLLIAISMAVVVAYILYQIVFENIDQRFNTQLVESGKLASEWMVQEENARLTNLRLLAYTSGVGDALQSGDANALRLATLGNTIGNQEDAVEFLNTLGNLVLSMRHRPGSLYVEDYVISTGGDTNYTQWKFVENVVTGKNDSIGDKYSGLARAPWGDYFYVSGPVYDRNNKFAGVVLVGEAMPTLVRKMRQDIGAQVTIYGMDGKPIASTFAPPEISLPNVTLLLEKQNSNSLRRDNDSNQSLVFNGIDYGEILGPWIVRNNQDLGVIGTALPKNLLVKTSATSRAQLAILVGVALFLVILIGGTIANLITQPLNGLLKASKEVTRGNYGVKVNPQSNDEIAELTNNFNLMISSIKKSHHDLQMAYDNTLQGWSKATDMRDNETDLHMHNVVDLTIKLATKMGIKDDQLIHIYRGALLHDVGKIGIPDLILKKPGKLNEAEWEVMKKHPQFAYDLLSTIEYLRPALDIPYFHHEKWDGTGYPNGLKGEEIPEIARIFSIVDVWDAMISDRVYRKAIPVEEVVQYIIDNRGTHFDPRVVDAFLPMIVHD